MRFPFPERWIPRPSPILGPIDHSTDWIFDQALAADKPVNRQLRPIRAPGRVEDVFEQLPRRSARQGNDGERP